MYIIITLITPTRKLHIFFKVFAVQTYIFYMDYIYNTLYKVYFDTNLDICLFLCCVFSAGTTKGTGGDVIILEEAAYVEQNFFYETVAPLLLVGVTSLICISTLTSEIK